MILNTALLTTAATPAIMLLTMVQAMVTMLMALTANTALLTIVAIMMPMSMVLIGTTITTMPTRAENPMATRRTMAARRSTARAPSSALMANTTANLTTVLREATEPIRATVM